MGGAIDNVSPLHSSLAAFLSSTSATFVFHPLELVKTKLQAQDNECKGRIRYGGAIDACKMIWRLEGIRGFYYGLSPSLVANGISWGSCFFIYRYIQSGHTKFNFVDQVIAASAAGILTTIVTNPVWVIKNRLQIQTSILHTKHYRGVSDAFRTIWRVEGIKGFYAGLGMSLASNSHAAVQLVLLDRLCDFVDRSSWGGGFFTALTVGGVARLVASVLTYPLQTVRTRLQERPGGGLRYQGTKDAFGSIYRNEGIQGFYRGFAVSTARTIPQAAYTFALLNYLLHKFPLNTT
eukprot:Phypoly_transcript_14500.p1 GENE.Phypoly_transcript_14500~~Phypoly_transcript_14500.p1  ORF type:complete len:292 (+),score=10.13 Phypoly_transcript_14500:98-973(+)